MNLMPIESETDMPAAAGLNFRQKLVVIGLDILLVVELCIAMYFANLSPETFTPTFVKTFFSQLFPTVFTALFFMRLLKNSSSGTSR